MLAFVWLLTRAESAFARAHVPPRICGCRFHLPRLRFVREAVFANALVHRRLTALKVGPRAAAGTCALAFLTATARFAEAGAATATDTFALCRAKRQNPTSRTDCATPPPPPPSAERTLTSLCAPGLSRRLFSAKFRSLENARVGALSDACRNLLVIKSSALFIVV